MASLTVGGGVQPWHLQRFRCCLHASTQNQLPVNSSTSGCRFGLVFFVLIYLIYSPPSHCLSDHQSTTTTVNCHLDGIPLPPLRVTGNNRCKTEWQNTRHRTFECCVRYHHTGGPWEHKYICTVLLATPVQYWCCPWTVKSSNGCKTGRCPQLVDFMTFSAGILY